MTLITTFLGIAAALVALTLMIRRNLRQRPQARKFRDLFIAMADDLVGKPEFPEAHARQLVQLCAIPGGWLTRAMVLSMIGEMITGRASSRPREELSLDRVPPNLRAKYAVAILSLAMSDSYRCALFGRVWRGANSWIAEAIADVKPDVNAHATRRVVARVNVAHHPRAVPAHGPLVTA